jgi:hypothetical protein
MDKVGAAFEEYLIKLPGDQLEELVKERIARLNPEQQAIALAREEQKKVRGKLIDKLADPDPDVHQAVFDAILDMETDECEHGRPHCKPCIECMEMDHIMFPELWDEEGNPIE